LPVSKFVRCISREGFHNMHYIEINADTPETRSRPVVVCCHGLTRNGLDFLPLMQHCLSKHFRVISMDVVGRGYSDWLKDKHIYGYPQYVMDANTLLVHLQANEVYWIGTSMGGIIGMTLASYKGTPIKKLVLNDVGAVVTEVSLKRLFTYVGLVPPKESLEEARKYLVAIYGDKFGKDVPPILYQRLALTSFHQPWQRKSNYGPMISPPLFVEGTEPRKDDNGDWLPPEVSPPTGNTEVHISYDLGIRVPWEKDPPVSAISLWPIYDQITTTTLLLHGEISDLLTSECAQEMTKRGPKAKLVEFPGVGHTPPLVTQKEFDLILNFLLV